MTVNDIQRLREATGAGVMECKKALVDAKGDFEQAVKLINERGLVKAESKSGRATGVGLLESYIHNSRIGVLMELRCETDFVAHTDPVKELSKNLVMQIAAMNPANIEDLLRQPFIKDEKMTIEALIKSVIAKVGENIKIERFCRYEL